MMKLQLWQLLKLTAKTVRNTTTMKNLKHVLNVSKEKATLWMLIFSSIDSYYTVQLMNKYSNGLGEVNIFYRFTPMSIEESMLFTTIFGVLLVYFLYDRSRTATEIILFVPTLFGTINFISYYFVPLEQKPLLHTVIQPILLVGYALLVFFYSEKAEGNHIKPFILPFKKSEE